MDRLNEKTGIDSIDKHHERLFGLKMMLEKIETEKDTNEALKMMLYKISFSAENYFQDEELLLKTHKYHNLGNHKKHHNWLLDEIRQIQNQYINGATDTIDTLKKLMDTWFEQHLSNYDKEALEFLQKHLQKS